MSQSYTNQGWYNNLWVVLSGTSVRYTLEVRIVTHFHFRPDPQLPFSPRDQPLPSGNHWTDVSRNEWKESFTRLINQSWSNQHNLYGDVSSRGIDLRRLTAPTRPVATVNLRIIDADSPPQGVVIPQQQVRNHVHVWRETSGRAHGSAVDRTLSITEADIRPQPSSTGSQTPAIHEIGHLLGLSHVNCWSLRQSSRNESAAMNSTRCYGGADGSTVMGTGDRIRERDYVVFAYIMRRIRANWIWFVGSQRAERPGGRQAQMEHRSRVRSMA